MFGHENASLVILNILPLLLAHLQLEKSSFNAPQCTSNSLNTNIKLN